MNHTRFVENSLQKAGSVTGFYIDIFPYDEISDDEAEMEKQLNRAVRWGMILSIYKVKEPQIGQYGPAKDFVMRSIWHILHGGCIFAGYLQRRSGKSATRHLCRNRRREVPG